MKGDSTTLDALMFLSFLAGTCLPGDVCSSHALYDEHMSPSRSQMLSPFCGITKEIMSRGPQVADMECSRDYMTNNIHLHRWRPFSPPQRSGFSDGIHHTSWLPRGTGPCSMRYKSGIMVSVISIFEAF
jgi:hypothetical protein